MHNVFFAKGDSEHEETEERVVSSDREYKHFAKCWTAFFAEFEHREQNC